MVNLRLEERYRMGVDLLRDIRRFVRLRIEDGARHKDHMPRTEDTPMIDLTK